MKSAEFYIKHLDMEPHIEGGYFKECLLSGDTISYRGMKDRRLWSSIYFLLREGRCLTCTSSIRMRCGISTMGTHSRFT